MNSRTFEFEGEIHSSGRIEPLDPDWMPALLQGDSDRLFDATVQAVVVDHQFIVDEQSTSIVAREVQGVDPGFADSKEAFEDEAAMFVPGSR